MGESSCKCNLSFILCLSDFLLYKLGAPYFICNNLLLQLKTSELFTEVIVGGMRVDKIIKEE